jgi:hypothetical protein
MCPCYISKCLRSPWYILDIRLLAILKGWYMLPMWQPLSFPSHWQYPICTGARRQQQNPYRSCFQYFIALEILLERFWYQSNTWLASYFATILLRKNLNMLGLICYLNCALRQEVISFSFATCFENATSSPQMMIILHTFSSENSYSAESSIECADNGGWVCFFCSSEVIHSPVSKQTFECLLTNILSWWTARAGHELCIVNECSYPCKGCVQKLIVYIMELKAVEFGIISHVDSNKN